MDPSIIWDLWNEWNIRGVVLLSFSLQVFLTLFAPFRKKTRDLTIAIFSIRRHSCACPVVVDHGAFQALWASFLFLHLGGPDNFTGFSLEENFLWRRHLLTLIFQLVIVIYFLVKIFPRDNSLMIPTILLIFAGVIKNMQRILAPIRFSFPRLKEWTVLQHKLRGSKKPIFDKAFNRLVKEGHIQEDGNDDEAGKLSESILVAQAYCFFQIFECFIGDLMITSKPQRKVSREYFGRISAMDVLRMISIELRFIYEVFHTKRMALRTITSYTFRFIAFANVAISFVLFNRWKKQHQLPFRALLDVKITYSLFFGGIALEVIALLMLVFSDLNVAWLNVYVTGSSKLNSCFDKLKSFVNIHRKPRLYTCEAELNASDSYEVLDTCIIFQRWSESISACNLFSESLKESPRKMHKCGQCWSSVTFSDIRRSICRVKEMTAAVYCQARGVVSAVCIYGGPEPVIANTAYVSKIPFTKKLWIFIFEEVKRKSGDVVDLKAMKRIFEARGEMFLESEQEEIRCNLSAYVTGVNYDTSILIWHIATEIRYTKDDQLTSPAAREEREFSKILSDYMFYLLVDQHDVVSAVAGFAQVTSRKMLGELREGYTNDGREGVKGLWHSSRYRFEYARRVGRAARELPK